jgi:hypothetical protein
LEFVGEGDVGEGGREVEERVQVVGIGKSEVGEGEGEVGKPSVKASAKGKVGE